MPEPVNRSCSTATAESPWRPGWNRFCSVDEGVPVVRENVDLTDGLDLADDRAIMEALTERVPIP